MSSTEKVNETLQIMIETIVESGMELNVDRSIDSSNDTNNRSQDKLTLYFETKDIAINGSNVTLNVVTDTEQPKDGSFIKKRSTGPFMPGCQYDSFKLFNKSSERYIALDLSDESKPKLTAASETEESLNRGFNFSMSMYCSGRPHDDDGATGNIALYFTTDHYNYYLTPCCNGTTLKIVRERKPTDCNDEQFKKHMWFTNEYINGLN